MQQTMFLRDLEKIKMNKINYQDNSVKELLKSGSHLRIMTDFLLEKSNPSILELGVERGSSTKAFVWFAEKVNGKVFSVDIDDCSKVVHSPNWKFLKSNDLDKNYILKNFDEIKEKGVDLIYIDSYHENFHVTKLLNLWFKYLKKDGAIFIDDTDGFPFREKKDTWNSIIYDLIDEAAKEFYYKNTENIIYTKYMNFPENGLVKLYKTSNFLEEPNFDRKIWNYNIFIKIVYPYLRKIRKLIKIIFKF